MRLSLLKIISTEYITRKKSSRKKTRRTGFPPPLLPPPGSTPKASGVPFGPDRHFWMCLTMLLGHITAAFFNLPSCCHFLLVLPLSDPVTPYRVISRVEEGVQGPTQPLPEYIMLSDASWPVGGTDSRCFRCLSSLHHIPVQSFLKSHYGSETLHSDRFHFSCFSAWLDPRP